MRVFGWIKKSVRRRLKTPIYEWESAPWVREFDFQKKSKRSMVGKDWVVCCGRLEVPMKQIAVVMKSKKGLVLEKVEKTPHFVWAKALKNGQEKAVKKRRGYEKYKREFFPKRYCREYIDGVERLLVSLLEDEWTNPDIIVRLPVKRKEKVVFPIHDGVHRTAVARVLGKKKLKVWLLPNKVNLMER